jgi:prolyl oligopeptidase
MTPPVVPPAPPTRRDDVVDVLHGVELADPYRWLEDGDDPATRAWVDAQNQRTRAVLDASPHRPNLHTRLVELLRACTSSGPAVAGDTVFSLDRWGEMDQGVLVARSADRPDEPRVVVDARHLVDDPTAAIDWYQPSLDGRLVAVGTSTGGDEPSTLRIVDAVTADPRPDEIPHTRAAAVAWVPDGSAFAYTRYPAPGEVPDDDLAYHRTVWWHDLGDDPAHDRLVWDALPDKTAWPMVDLSRDGRWLLVHVSLGWSRVDVHLLDRRSGDWVTVIEGTDAVAAFEVDGERLVGTTTLDADRGRVVAAPLTTPQPDQWRTLVAESDAVVEAVGITPDSLLVASTHRAVSQLVRYRPDGTFVHAVHLPELGSLAGLSADPARDRAFFSFTSFARPAALFRLRRDPTTEAWSDLPSGVRPADFVVEQVRYPSTDGTDISMFLIRAATTTPDLDTATVLTGYGGFAITMGPAYSPAVAAVCERGGQFAVANIRGGSEEGEAWHRAGMGEHKQQVFDDFCAAADWLVDTGRTSRARLAIRGGSNGGLLVGAALTQRPDLCRAVHCAVPLLDMVRFHLFRIARLWIPEYGDPERPEDFAWLHAYSPYHRVVDGTCYPAVLVTTGEEDSRVDPNHARKMTARLQEATTCGDERPVLLRLETRAGHGQGKPVSKQADELADVLAFFADQLGE